jgi:hypothetical protein
MTKEEIRELSGPPLSEAVAEHVMRWQRLHTAPGVERRGSTWADAAKNWHLIPHGPPLRPADAGLFGIVAEVWEPHCDMRAAWQVFMAVSGKKKTLQVRDGRFYAVVDEGDLIEGETPEIAICRTSLLAVLAP